MSTLCSIAVASLALGGPFTMAQTPEPGLTLAGPAPSPKVTNGTAHERASLPADLQALVVPPSVRLVRLKALDRPAVFTTKTLGFLGHPPEPMHIREARHYLGVAFQRVGRTLRLAPFGGLQTPEGSACLQILLQVPETMKVTVDASLEHRAQGKGHLNFDDPRLRTCWWYGPLDPAKGWTRLDMRLDPEATASRH